MSHLRAFSLVFCLILFFPPSTLPRTLEIYHIDVGQGDATLVVSPSGKTLLIDGGDTGQGSAKVVPLLQALKIPSLDYTLATHYDAAHIGGLDEVIFALGGKINVESLDRGLTDKNTKVAKEYRKAVQGNRREIQPGDRIDMGTEIEIICVAVNQVVIGGIELDRKVDDENGNSVALLIRFKDFDYFIGGI